MSKKVSVDLVGEKAILENVFCHDLDLSFKSVLPWRTLGASFLI